MDKLYQKIIPKAMKPPTEAESVTSLINQLEAKEQINLGIHVKPENKVKKIRKKTRNWIEIMKINPYWKQFSSITMFITALSGVGAFAFLFLYRYTDLPNQIPTIYNQSIKAWTYTAKDELVFFPIAQLVVTLILVKLNLAIFKFDRRLVLVINNSMILLNIIFLYEIYQIYTMLMVY